MTLKRLLTGWLLPLNYQLMQLVKKIFAPREVKKAEMMMMSIGNCDMNFFTKVSAHRDGEMQHLFPLNGASYWAKHINDCATSTTTIEALSGAPF